MAQSLHSALWRGPSQLSYIKSYPCHSLAPYPASFFFKHLFLPDTHLFVCLLIFPSPTPLPNQLGSFMRAEILCVHVCVYFNLFFLVFRLDGFY